MTQQPAKRIPEWLTIDLLVIVMSLAIIGIYIFQPLIKPPISAAACGLIAQLDQRNTLPDQCLHSAEADVRPQTDAVEKVLLHRLTQIRRAGARSCRRLCFRDALLSRRRRRGSRRRGGIRQPKRIVSRTVRPGGNPYW